ncbi:MAG: PLP-dependent aminotransferase family protein [Chloroflexaceae bacterium]|jgi:DNA-binding transcriptional MocR family regulator|nr:PLP-dependent aminotransferase family protein [Chloroflexaceae bacterium]
MQINLNRTSREPLYRQLASNLQQRIRSGALPAGTRLPTVRQLAAQLGVTRLTVHSAYAELQSGGWIEATVGRGTFVAQQVASLLTPPEAELGREVTPAGMLADLLRTTQIPGLIGLGKADPAVEHFPIRHWQRALDMALSSGGPAMLNYTTAQGDLMLRSTLAELLRGRGLAAGPDEILITSGAMQGLALAADLLARPGDTVLVEQPTYLGLLQILSVRGLRAVGLPMDDEGLDVAALETILKTERPAFLYTIPTFQNPSGICLSPRRRTALLQLAAYHRLQIVEDDIYGRLGYEGQPPPALKGHDHEGLVVHIGSFSKDLMPGLRLGYVVTTPELARRFVAARQSQDMCSPLLTQRALNIFIEQGWFHAHLRRMLPHYRERRDALLRAMERFFPSGVYWTQPRGGFACWVTLPHGIPMRDLYLSAINRGVVIAPGLVFEANADPRPHLRLCFSAEPPERISEGVAILGSLLRERSLRQPMVAPAVSDYVPLV